MAQYDEEQEEAPEWFQSVDFEEVAAELNDHLRALLEASSLGGALGEALAERLTVSKWDNYHDEGAEPELQYDSGVEELSEITAELSHHLQKILRGYGAPEEAVAFAVVRRWDMLAAAENFCSWSKVWTGGQGGRWCSIKTCC